MAKFGYLKFCLLIWLFDMADLVLEPYPTLLIVVQIVQVKYDDEYLSDQTKRFTSSLIIFFNTRKKPKITHIEFDDLSKYRW